MTENLKTGNLGTAPLREDSQEQPLTPAQMREEAQRRLAFLRERAADFTLPEPPVPEVVWEEYGSDDLNIDPKQTLRSLQQQYDIISTHQTSEKQGVVFKAKKMSFENHLPHQPTRNIEYVKKNGQWRVETIEVHNWITPQEFLDQAQENHTVLEQHTSHDEQGNQCVMYSYQANEIPYDLSLQNYKADKVIFLQQGDTWEAISLDPENAFMDPEIFINTMPQEYHFEHVKAAEVHGVQKREVVYHQLELGIKITVIFTTDKDNQWRITRVVTASSRYEPL